jgi:hypothetical protein
MTMKVLKIFIFVQFIIFCIITALVIKGFMKNYSHFDEYVFFLLSGLFFTLEFFKKKL